MNDSMIKPPSPSLFIAELDEVCRLGRARLRDLKQMLPYAIDDEQRSALENMCDSQARINDRLLEMRSQIIGILL